jgi:hypothetical protein
MFSVPMIFNGSFILIDFFAIRHWAMKFFLNQVMSFGMLLHVIFGPKFLPTTGMFAAERFLFFMLQHMSVEIVNLWERFATSIILANVPFLRRFLGRTLWGGCFSDWGEASFETGITYYRVNFILREVINLQAFLGAVELFAL